MRRYLLPLVFIIAVVVLTVLTQIGGLVLVSVAVVARLLRRGALVAVALFVVAYGTISVLVVPPVAALGGRVPLPCSGEPLRTLPLLCVLNRHYVTPKLRDLAQALASDLAAEYPAPFA